MHIQSLRGLACVLLVLFHVAGDAPDAGLRLPQDHPLQFFNHVLMYFRMPLFAVIAGYVYARRPCGPDWTGFLLGKARRLLLPLLSVGTAFALVQAAAPGANTRLASPWQVLVLPTAHFWFLQALFLVFLCTAALERLGLLRTWRRALLLAGAAAALHGVISAPAWFSLDGAVYLLQYFVLGVAARLMPAPPRALLVGAGLAFGVLALGVLASDQPFRHPQSLVTLAISGLGTWLLVFLPWQQPLLARLGDHSYAIFLFHVFFTAASRIALQRLGVDELAVLVSVGLAAGILGPVAIGLLIARIPWAATLLTGAKPPVAAITDARKGTGVRKVHRVPLRKDDQMLAGMSGRSPRVPSKRP